MEYSMTIDIEQLNELAVAAGDAIMEVYNSADFGVEHKEDNSPLTRADKAAHEIIAAKLGELYPGIPLISEEGKDISYAERKSWNRFWLVDPLDGTKEFIKRNGEFTVNIALVSGRQTVLGVIYAPVLETLYYGEQGKGAFKRVHNSAARELCTNRDYSKGLIAVQSRSHSGNGESEFFGQHKISDSIAVGSSLKFCMLAEAKADMYYRHGPTWEWDTAAGQAILEAAGGIVSDGGEQLLYNKPSLKNDDGFLCLASPALQEASV